MNLPINALNYFNFKESIYDFINCDYDKINSSIASTYWPVTFKNRSIDETLDVFYKILYNIINLHCNKMKFSNNTYLLWFSIILKKLIFRKKMAHIIFKSSPSSSNYNNFSNLRALC